MASYMGLAAVIIIVIFIVGVLCGILILVAAGVRGEDGATMRRGDRRLVLRDQPVGFGARGVRRLNGVGQRIGGPDSGHQ